MTITLRKLIGKLSAALFHPGYHTTGFCNVCNRQTFFVCDLAVDRWIRKCCWCRSTPKYRAIVNVIESETKTKLAHYIQTHRIYEMSTTGPIFRQLRGHRNYDASGYFSDKPFGKKMNALYWNQDLQNLSFPSESFDAVISSETMEHVRRPWQGFAEVCRVLKDGGLYVFTVPHRDDRQTRSRVETAGDQDVFLLEKAYHQDPYRREDSLVYTDFGTDLPDRLQLLGFDTKAARILDMKMDIQDDLRPVTVFLARKRSAISSDRDFKTQSL